ncbi:AAA family ATPase [Legionella rowbothamii]|uniref:AAA family ATPase n=1 Tax=Legionella rowbothamii TaxID=96229 RepID=UPI001056DF78|nr:AAA family ATPase [Legionella rowbothamii]
MFAKDVIATPSLPIFIMLSGVPCVGKSTWREQMVQELNRLNIPITVLSADDMAFQMGDELQLSYSDIFAHHRNALEERFKRELLKSRSQSGGFVILDRTYLNAPWRKETLKLINSKSVHIVTFNVMDEQAWRENLKRRNEQNPKKIVTDKIVSELIVGASPPSKEEGFASIKRCLAISEKGAQETFTHAIRTLISYCKTTETHTADLHCHLNGSFSLAFMERIARKNNCFNVYEELVKVREHYLNQTQNQPAEGYPGELIALIWKQFGLIHKIVQTLDDITEGTIDVVQSSAAKYLEIRTTPKSMDNHSVTEYIDAFEAGLVQVQASNIGKKAVGLLSLDRTIHTVSDAEFLIQRILSSSKHVLAGIDVSGNPLGKRSLTGQDLKNVISLALNKGVNIAIHMGESDTDIERQDTDMVLDALEEWVKQQPSPHDALHGRVRLGHCIYLTEQQKLRIKELNVPIEVCPTCHMKLNWHHESTPHPVSSIYSGVEAPLVPGTDDTLPFGGTAKSNFSDFLRFFGNAGNLSRKEIKAHQSTFRFTAH